ncbi:hypothetical protein [Pusillimonas sp. T2]|uniref:hypothetical protein n=1 Tax=Pusillimonas sp. T2 TaxID=1548123 RepID=UPI0013036776|nr:hypothetical protein [Pusillimonas sp. T2]
MSPANHILCSGSTAWRSGAVSRRHENAPAQACINLHADLAMTEWYCPVSGALLAVDVHRKDTSPQNDVMLQI